MVKLPDFAFLNLMVGTIQAQKMDFLLIVTIQFELLI